MSLYNTNKRQPENFSICDDINIIQNIYELSLIKELLIAEGHIPTSSGKEEKMWEDRQ